MIVKYSQLKKAPIADLDTQRKLGEVSDIIFNKTNLKIKAVLLWSVPYIQAKYIVTFEEIVELNNKSVLVQSEDAVSPLKENVRARDAFKEGYCGLDHKVYTKSGKRVGKVEDITFLAETGDVLKIYVKSVFADRIIDRSNIVDFDGKKIVVEDDYHLVKNGAEELCEVEA